MMNTVYKIGLFVGMLVCLLSLSSTYADNIDSYPIVVFGDSLSDNGNLEAALNVQGQSFPAEAFGGRASDGILGVEVLSFLLGDALEPSLFTVGLNNGSNYAVATARARAANPLGIDLPSQVGAYLLNNNGQSSSDSVFIFQIGGNDLRDAFFTTENGKKIIDDAVSSLSENVEKIIHSGAKKLMVVNLPKLTDLPEIKNLLNTLNYKKRRKEAVRARYLSYYFNKKLAKSIDRVAKKNPETKIVNFSFPQFVRTMKRNATAFHFNNIDQGCLTLDLENLVYIPTPPCDLNQDIDNYLFFDQIHLSGATHEYLGRSLYSQLPR